MVKGMDVPTPDEQENYFAGLIEANIADPYLQGIARSALQTTVEVGARLAVIADSRATQPEVEPVLIQSRVDALVDQIVPDEKADDFDDARELFSLLEGKTKIENGELHCELSKAFTRLLFAGNPKPQLDEQSKVILGGTRARKLADYLDGEHPKLTDEDIKQVRDTVIKPVVDVFYAGLDTFQTGNPTNLPIIREHAAKLETIDPSLDLGEIKMLVFASIADIFKQPDFSKTTTSIILLNFQDNLSAITTIIQNNPTVLPYSHAADYIEKLKTNSPEKMHEMLSLYRSTHNSDRLLGLPNRQFISSLDRLETLGETWLGIEYIERQLKRLPAIKEATALVRSETEKIEVSSVIKPAISVLSTGFQEMVERQSQKFADAGEENEEAEKAIWEESDGFEIFIVGTANEIIRVMEAKNVTATDSTLEQLQILSERHIHELIDKNNEEKLLAELEIEIAKKQVGFELIDSNYSVSNKQLRERAPQAIGAAKQISDSLVNHEPLGIDSSRAVAALMLGAYWENTGKDAGPEELASKYLEDAEKLRAIALELEYLGQPQDSKLLNHINLLDELIDTGIFDNKAKHPEFEIFEDFLVAYTIAKESPAEPVAQPTEITPTPEPESDVIDLPTESDNEPEITEDAPDVEAEPESDNEPDEPIIPIETIRQARYEDIMVFPPGSSAEEIARDYVEGVDERDLPSIEWERIRRLVELRDQFTKQQLEAELYRTRHASWQTLPFFVMEVRLPDAEHSVAVVESPVYGNATYIYREASDRLSWRDVVQLERREARELGAVPAVHVDGRRLDQHFRKLWDRVISELTINQ